MQETVSLPEQVTLEPPHEAPWRIAGEVLRTYIICEDEGENVWLIDKHAAHERVRFDALKAAAEPVMTQTLLEPLAVELPPEDCAAVLEQLPLLERYGFRCEDFGGAVLVREVPGDIDDPAGALEELAEDLRLNLSLIHIWGRAIWFRCLSWCDVLVFSIFYPVYHIPWTR